MKNTLRKTLSLFLAFTLLCSLGLTAAASEAMGEDLTSKGTLLNQKTQLSTNVFYIQESAVHQSLINYNNYQSMIIL